jgi:uncharacterized protein involved in exopolysaccharide biosynthesis
MVQAIREQIASADKLKTSLEAEYPELTRIQPPSSKAGARVGDLSDEAAQIVALQAKFKVLTNQYGKLNADAKAINELEPAITELQRKKELEETRYHHFSTLLEQARFDRALSDGVMPNINEVQAPTPACQESRKLVKTLGMIVCVGVFIGIALAGLSELGNSIRRKRR